MDSKLLHLVAGAVEHTDDSVMITEAPLEPPGPVIAYVNPAFERMTGYRAREVVGKTPRILQGPRTSRAVVERMKSDLRGVGRFHGETINYGKDGAEFRVEWHVSALRDAQGEITHWVGIQRDVTRQRAMERALVELDERERMAAGFDLHEGLCQQLVALSVRAATLAKDLAPDQASDARNIAVELDAVTAQARRLSSDLFPLPQGAARLTDGIASLLKGAPCEATLHHGSLPDTPRPVHAIQLYRVVEQALASAAARGAKQVRVDLFRNDAPELVVEDDAAEPPSEWVQQHMRLRARYIGGMVSCEALKPVGHRMVCTWEAD